MGLPLPNFKNDHAIKIMRSKDTIYRERFGKKTVLLHTSSVSDQNKPDRFRKPVRFTG
jgi:hypothetical protein